MPENVLKLVEQREKARLEKDFAKADDLRKEVEKLGYVIDDTSQGPTIKSLA